jgi:aspartate carbamoyltransferase catalytic subunit
VRHGASGVPELLARALDGPAVINAGDGAREHPTQALLDCLTIRQHKRDFGGLKVAIVGDIARSRVARSDIHALRRLGARVHVAGPPTLLPAECASLGVTVHHRIEPALDGADVVIMLRIQMERGSESGSPFPTLREYSRTWGLNARNLRLCAPDAIVMHPGPLNRGVEIAPDVADGERSVILDQVENGVAVRMAVLFILASARE